MAFGVGVGGWGVLVGPLNGVAVGVGGRGVGVLVDPGGGVDVGKVVTPGVAVGGI